MDFTGIPSVPDNIQPVSKSPFYQASNNQAPAKPQFQPTPNITIGNDSIVTDFVSDKTIKVDATPSDVEVAEKKKHRGRPNKENTQGNTAPIIRSTDGNSVATKEGNASVSGTVEDAPTMYTYMETTNELRQITNQLDAMNSALVEEFLSVRRSRTMKNKYNTLIGLSENINDNISNKINAIKEINSSISKSNDLDYKRQKDMAAAKAEVNDDKYVADLYKGFINNPGSIPNTPQLPPIDVGTYGSGIIRADLHGNNGSNAGDTSYMNYITNMSPEQNLMMYEDNPNIKQAVIYNEATGEKVFQYVDMRTNQVIPNMPTYDNIIMQDTIIDVRNKIAKNNNIHETFPVIIVGQDTSVANQY